MPSNYLNRVALDTDTELPTSGIIANVTEGLPDWAMTASGALQALEAAIGTAGTGGTTTPTNPGDRLVCTSLGASAWLARAPVSVQTGTAYTFVAADAAQVVECSASATVTVTVPPNSSVAFPVGTELRLTRTGTGPVTVAAGVGVTIQTPSTLTLRGQWSTVTLRQRAADSWIVAGDLAGSADDLFVRKPADTGRVSTVTLADDPHLTLTAAAGVTYEVSGFVIYDGDNAADLILGWTVPSGATLDWYAGGYQTGVGTGGVAATIRQQYATAASTGEPVGATTTGSKVVSRPQGLLVVGGTGGAVTLRWAQSVSSATTTTVYAGSYLRLRKVA